MEFPKIDTIWTRDEKTFKVQHGQFRWPEFTLPRHWLVTEKVDGTNVRIILRPITRMHDGTILSPEPGDPPSVTYGGRTANAQMPTFLLNHLQRTFPVDRVAAAFDPDTSAILYGEGYGPKIQRGGLYAPDVRVRLFDVVVFGENGRPWWLTWENVEDVARKLGVPTVPVLARRAELDEALALLHGKSVVATEDGGPGCDQEGIVARTEPPLFTRAGRRLCWKLKAKDY